MFSPYKDKIDKVCASLQAYFKIEHDGDINKYIGKYLDRRPDVSIHIRQLYITQRIFNMIPVMEKSSTNPTPMVKPILTKN